MDFKLIAEYGLAFLTIFGTVFFLLVFLQNRTEARQRPKLPEKLPSLTIIIPAYNEEKGIARTIESTLGEDYPLQIIVVDDGSIDQTLQIARQYEKRGVTVISQKNAGKSSAINRALEKVNTDFVATLDADSFIERGAVKKMIGFFGDPKVAAVTSAVKVEKPKGLLQGFQRTEYLQIIFIRKILSLINSVNVTPGPLSIFRKSALDEVGHFDETSILEDQEMALRLQEADYKIASSLDAIVYTRVPSSVAGLLRQRVRWNRGGLRNLLKHRKLLSPKYGDLGIFVLPFALLSIIIVFLAMFLAASAVINGSMLQLAQYGLDTFWLGINPLYAVSAIILALTITWVFLGIRELDNEKIGILDIAAYLFIYAQFVALCWLATAWEEVTRKKQRW